MTRARSVHHSCLLATLITPPYQVGEFAPWRALVLIMVTAVLGYALGGLIGVIWNRVHTSPRGA